MFVYYINKLINKYNNSNKAGDRGEKKVIGCFCLGFTIFLAKNEVDKKRIKWV